MLKRCYLELIPLKQLQKADPLVKNLFPRVEIPKVPLAGCLKHFVRMWEKLTRDQEILDIVIGNTIPMLSKPLRRSVSIRKSNLTDTINHDRK